MNRRRASNKEGCPVFMGADVRLGGVDHCRLVRQTRSVIALVEETLCLRPGMTIDWHVFIDRVGPEFQAIAYADMCAPGHSPEEEGECFSFCSYGVDVTLRWIQ